MHRVDSHAHIFTHLAEFVENARYTPNYTACLERYIAELEHFHIQSAVLVQPSFYGTNNGYLLNEIARFRHPTIQLKAVVVVPETTPFSELQQLQQAGVVGVRLNLFGLPMPDLRQPTWQTFLTALSQLNLHLELHCPPHYSAKLLPILTACRVVTVIDHLGRPEPSLPLSEPHFQTLLDLLDPTLHWVKLSGIYRLAEQRTEAISRAKTIYEWLKQRGMLGRIVWGSDFPHTQYENAVSYEQVWQDLLEVVPSEVERNQILSDNAQQLFSF